MTTNNATMIKKVNNHKKLWRLPTGNHVLTSFSTFSKETMAFNARPTGAVESWAIVVCVDGDKPEHEEVIRQMGYIPS